MPVLKPIRGIQLNRTHPLARGLVALWLFNEGSGITVFDLSGSRHIGTRHGTGTIWTPGKFGFAQQFNGVDDNIVIRFFGAGIFAGKAEGSIVTWVKPTDADDNKRFFDETTSTVGYTRFGLEHDSSVITMKWRDSDEDPGGVAGSITTGEINNDVWQQIVAVYDSGNNSQKIYINAVEAASASNAVAAFGTTTSAGITVGASPQPANFLQSLMDHMMLYDRALSVSEIRLLYQKNLCMIESVDISRYFSIPAAVEVVAAGARSHVGFKPIEGMNRLRGLGSSALY